MISPKDNPGNKIIKAIIYSELRPSGTDAVAWVIKDGPMSSRDLTQVGLKSLSLMLDEEPDELDLMDPKTIIQEKSRFGIIPYVDQGAIGLSYLFSYLLDDKTIYATLTILVPEQFKEFLFLNHDALLNLLKYASFEILKDISVFGCDVARIERRLQLLDEKLDRLIKNRN